MNIIMILCSTNEINGLLHQLCLRVATDYHPQKRLLVWLPKELLTKCDTLLWQVPAEAFIPHTTVQGADWFANQSVGWAFQQMVLLSDNIPFGVMMDTIVHQNRDPIRRAVCETVVELVLNQPADTEAARVRYRYYQSQQWPIQLINHR